MNTYVIDWTLADPFQGWYDCILECLLKAGASLLDGEGHIKGYFKGRIVCSPLNKDKKMDNKFRSCSPWWDRECDILINKRKWAFKTLSRRPTRENLINYRRVSSLVRKELQKKKRNSFRDFVSNLNLVSNPVAFWDTIKKFKNSHIHRGNNPLNLVRQTDVDSYVTRLAPAGLTLKLNPAKSSHFPSFFNHRFRVEEIKEIIDSLKAKSSPGPDLIDHAILKLIPDVGLARLLEVFEGILRGDFYPKLWRNYAVICDV